MIVVFVLLIIVIYALIYTHQKKNYFKIDFITNNLVYKKNRVQIDFCGIDNDISDTLRSHIIYDETLSTDEFTDQNIDLYELGLTSEYMLDIVNNSN